MTDQRMRLAVDIVVENGQFKAEIVNSEQLTKKIGQTGKESFGALGEAAARVDGPIGRVTRSVQGLLGMTSRLSIGLYAGVAALAAWGAATMKGTQLFAENERALKRQEAQIRATGGAAGKTVEQLEQQERALSRSTLFSGGDIQRAQSILLTFKSVSGAVFDATIATAADMAEIMGGDLSSAVMQLGKALEDPEQGLSALTRSGISFNAEQKETIKNLAETGRKGAALEMILATVNSQLGPAATAAADGYAGAVHRLAESWDELLESLERTELIGGAISRLETLINLARRSFAPTEEEQYQNNLQRSIYFQSEIERGGHDPALTEILKDQQAQVDAEILAFLEKDKLGSNGSFFNAAAPMRGSTLPTPAADKDAGKKIDESDVRAQIRAFNEEIAGLQREERDRNEQLLDQYDELGAAARQRTEDQIRLQELAAQGDERAITALNNMALGLDGAGDAWEETADRASSALDVFGDEAARNIQNIGVALLRGRELGENFFDTMLSGLADMSAQIAVSGFFRYLFGGLAGSSNPFLSAVGSFFGGGATVAHSGGVIGQDALPTRQVPAFVFAGAPRYHNGMLSSWLGPNERPAILEAGESVLTPAQMRAAGGARGPQFSVTYNIDASGGTQAAQIVALQRVLRENNRQLMAQQSEAKVRKL